MRKHITSRNAAFFAAGGFAAALFLGGAAHAITDTVFKYSRPQIGYTMIPASAFVPQSSSATYTNLGYWIGFAGGACFTAAVNNLPQGAKFTALAFWYDKNDTDAVTIELARMQMSNHDIGTIALAHAGDTTGQYVGANVKIADASLQTVDNGHYLYFINQCMSSTEHFWGARVAFTYTTAGN